MNRYNYSQNKSWRENVFSPLCFHMWYFNEEFFENADPHTSQENGFSPVCVRMWTFK